MSLSNGLEYINTSKRKLKAQLQDKGVVITNDTPFMDYSVKLGTELKNKSWQYPSDWFQLTPKSEFPDRTIEVIAFDSGHDLGFYIGGKGKLYITVFGGNEGGTYLLNGTLRNLNQQYTLAGGGGGTFRFNRGTGLPSNLQGFTTFKIVLTLETRLDTFYPKFLAKRQPISMLAVRAKDTTNGTKSIYFDVSDTAQYNCLHYCDLSMVNNLKPTTGQFNDCHQLVKCELPSGFVLADRSFGYNYNLREVIGADFVNVYDRERVFEYCCMYTPPSFNYVGRYSYWNTALQGMDIVPPDFKHYPECFITPIRSGLDGHDIDTLGTSKCRINIPDTVESLAYTSFNDLENETILHLPSGYPTVTGKPDRLLNPQNGWDTFISSPYLIENGENFYLDTAMGIYLDIYYGDEEVYLPHVPLEFLNASSGGNLKKITFDWNNTTFSNLVSSAIAIDITGHKFDHDDLIDLFNSLPLTAGGINLKITGNPGASTLTDEEIALVIDKGYILTK